jgi:hypothetical protein
MLRLRMLHMYGMIPIWNSCMYFCSALRVPARKERDALQQPDALSGLHTRTLNKTIHEFVPLLMHNKCAFVGSITLRVHLRTAFLADMGIRPPCSELWAAAGVSPIGLNTALPNRESRRTSVLELHMHQAPQSISITSHKAMQ